MRLCGLHVPTRPEGSRIGEPDGSESTDRHDSGCSEGWELVSPSR